MNKLTECDNFLKYLSKIYLQNPEVNINYKTIYYQLSTIGINNNIKVNSLFSRWINRFKDNPNIKVFVSENWKYFCQFKNNEYSKSVTLNSPIKMYIPLKPDNIDKCISMIFDFISKNRMYNNSKVATDIRNDNLVVRVYNKEDAKKISDFINTNSFIIQNMNKPNPFLYEENHIGYAIDGFLSFNSVLSTYIANYLKICKNSNKLDQVNINDFIFYLKKIYKEVFIDRIDTDVFLRTFDGPFEKSSKDSIINNYKEVTKLILDSLNDTSFIKFLNDVDEFNGIEKLTEPTKQELNIDLFNEYILFTIKKYGLELGKKHLENYIYKGNVNAITRDNDLRNRMYFSLTPNNCLNILSNKTIDDYIEILTKIKPDEIRLYALDNAVKETLVKYGYKQSFEAILKSIDGNFNYFTNTNNVRVNLLLTTSMEDIKTFFTKSGKIDVDKISKYLNDIELSIETRRKK